MFKNIETGEDKRWKGNIREGSAEVHNNVLGYCERWRHDKTGKEAAGLGKPISGEQFSERLLSLSEISEIIIWNVFNNENYDI